MTPEELRRIHQTSSKGRESLLSKLDEVTPLCGCFYCGRIYHPIEIDEWCDGGDTAICPYCGIDSIIDGIQNDVTYDVLEALHQEYFLKGRTPDGATEQLKDSRIYKINDPGKPKVTCISKVDTEIVYRYSFNSQGRDFELTVATKDGAPFEASYFVWMWPQAKLSSFYPAMEEEIEKIFNKEVELKRFRDAGNGHGSFDIELV